MVRAETNLHSDPKDRRVIVVNCFVIIHKVSRHQTRFIIQPRRVIVTMDVLIFKKPHKTTIHLREPFDMKNRIIE